MIEQLPSNLESFLISGENPVFEDNEIFKVSIPISKTLVEVDYYICFAEKIIKICLDLFEST